MEHISANMKQQSILYMLLSSLEFSTIQHMVNQSIILVMSPYSPNMIRHHQVGNNSDTYNSIKQIIIKQLLCSKGKSKFIWSSIWKCNIITHRHRYITVSISSHAIPSFNYPSNPAKMIRLIINIYTQGYHKQAIPTNAANDMNPLAKNSAYSILFVKYAIAQIPVNMIENTKNRIHVINANLLSNINHIADVS